MAKIKAIVPFAFYEEKRGTVNVDEGAEDVIDDAEAQRLAAAGIVEIIGAVKPARHAPVETADKKPAVETADKKLK